MAARRRIWFGLRGLLALLVLLFPCTEVRAAVDFAYGAAARTQAQPGDTVLLYTGPAATAAEAKAAAAALARERAYYEAQGATVYAFGLGGLLPDVPDASCTAIAPDAATLGMGVEALSARAAQAGFDILCCNLTTSAGEALFPPGRLYGDIGVLAFTEPAALAGLPAEARAACDMNGEVARVLIEYAAAQLRAEGASTIVLLAVCPVEEAGRPWRGEDLRLQCTGIDVWIEAQAPENAAEGPTADGLVLYAAPTRVGALRIPGAAQAESAPAQASPTKTVKPSQTPKPVQTPQPTETARPARTAQPSQTLRPTRTSTAETAQPTQADAAPAQTASPIRTIRPSQTPRPTAAANPTRTPQPVPASVPAETPGGALDMPAGGPVQAPPRSPEEEAARRALALEEGQRRQDYIPPNAVYTGGTLHSPLLLVSGALCFACAMALRRKRGGRA